MVAEATTNSGKRETADRRQCERWFDRNNVLYVSAASGRSGEYGEGGGGARIGGEGSGGRKEANDSDQWMWLWRVDSHWS